jgi:hypothetical protein
MATVYITQELSTRVSNAIRRMQDLEITQHNAEINKAIEVDTSEFLTKAMWGNHLHIKDQLPSEWLSINTGPTLHVKVPVAIEDIDDAEISHQIGFRNQKVINRPNHDRWSEPKIYCTKAYLEAHDYMAGVPEILQFVDRIELNREIKAKWSKVEADVMLFLGKCKSLNEAIKLWPGIKMYVPHEYIQRVEQKIERKVREKQIIDSTPVEELTAAAVAARLSGITA